MSTLVLRSIQFALACATAIPTIAVGGPTPRAVAYVKSTGVDQNLITPCAQAVPCRTFAFAADMLIPGGRVVVLDTAGYGPMTITKSMSIVAPPGIYAGITVSSGDGITVNGSGIVVQLKGLSINGIGGASGISFMQGAELHVSNCVVSNMAADGISASATGGWLFVSDSTFRSNAGAGIRASGSLTAIVDRSRVENQGAVGIVAQAGASLSVHDSAVSGSAGGVSATADLGATTRATVDASLLADNSGSGAAASSVAAGSLATLDVIRTTSTRSSSGSGASASATPPASAILTVADSALSENSAFGVVAVGNSVALANRNTIARNASGGLSSPGGGLLHTRSNNAGEQANPTVGTITAVPGF